MNIWDSVQRGLEKATHEAGRIARIQRLRSTIDNLSRQTTVQQSNLVTRALEVFAAGKLTQSELLPICQELTSLQQQLEQAQAELKLVQSQGAPVTTPQTTAMHSPLPLPATSGMDLAATVFPPPPPGYQQPLDATQPAPLPPPPPGSEPRALSELETLAMGAHAVTPPTGSVQASCPRCGAERLTGYAYCANCGQPFEDPQAAHLPTMQANPPSGPYTADLETRRESAMPAEVSEQPTIYTPASPPGEHQQEDRGEPPSAPDRRSPASEQDGGQ